MPFPPQKKYESTQKDKKIGVAKIYMSVLQFSGKNKQIRHIRKGHKTRTLQWKGRLNTDNIDNIQYITEHTARLRHCPPRQQNFRPRIIQGKSCCAATSGQTYLSCLSVPDDNVIISTLCLFIIRSFNMLYSSNPQSQKLHTYKFNFSL